VTEQIYDYGYRTPRFNVDFRLLLQTDDRLPRLLDVRCLNLSEDGVAVETGELLEIGAKVTLILTLPGNPTSRRIAAKVTNRHPDGYGLAFIFASQNERSYICDYLAAQR
jgi:Tfp pilus assembly protein PilZ